MAIIEDDEVRKVYTSERGGRNLKTKIVVFVSLTLDAPQPLYRTRFPVAIEDDPINVTSACVGFPAVTL